MNGQHDRQITPIFIFSMPRSGSTLLQKVVGYQSEVQTTSETWMFLSVLSLLRRDSMLADYSYNKWEKALIDLNVALELNGSEKFEEYLRATLNQLMLGLSNEQHKFFLEKTPRNYLIIDSLAKLFPEAKFVFLFRNPLSILSSQIVTHGNRLKHIYSTSVDWNVGFQSLSNAYKKYEHRSVALCYEDLVLKPNKIFEVLENYLDIDLDRDVIDDLNKVQLHGTWGDPGLTLNQNIRLNSDSLEKWKIVIDSDHKKKFVSRAIRNIPESYFESLSLSKAKCLSELSLHKTKLKFVDVYDYYFLNLTMSLRLWIYTSRKRWVKYVALS